MKILVFGKSGQVAQELQRAADVTALDRHQADLCDPAACAQIIRTCDADVIINAAAYTAVDLAESETTTAFVVNGKAPSAMALAAAHCAKPFLHISTDYVFDGSGNTAWTENDKTAPISIYGKSKLSGEQGVINAGGKFAILRTSWVFSGHGSNFVKTMLRLGQDRDALSIVNDQIGGPTSATSIAAALLTMAKSFANGGANSGIYHFSGAPATSWDQFANEIFCQSSQDVKISGIPTSQYPTDAQRPLNSRLDCRAIDKEFGIKQPNWRADLHDVLTKLRS